MAVLDRARHLTRWLTDPRLSRSYYPSEPHKSKLRILAELAWSRLRDGEVNKYYYAYGQDCKTPHRDTIGYQKFRRIRDRANRAGPYDYVCVLRDKFLSALFLATFGIPTPRTYAVFEGDRVIWKNPDLETLDIVGFCKPLTGTCGVGARPFNPKNAELDGRYLFQERLQQHPDMAALHPASVNTVRLITFHDNDVELFSAAQRIGAHNMQVDNWAAGGLVTRINPQTGQLEGDAYFRPGHGTRTPTHSDTGIAFHGYRIPYFYEAVTLVKQAHRHIPDIYSVGWDVAITPKGPVIIEGNDDWEGGIPMVLEKDFKPRFLAKFPNRNVRLP